MTVGILALQGDVREHAAAFDEVGVATRPVRRPADLAGIVGVVLPGGESTTLSMLLESSGLFEPLAAALAAGLPAFGTCAGLVLLARNVLDGRPDQRSFGVLDCTVRRNGYGRQRFSFESVLHAPSLAGGEGSPATGPEGGSGPAAGLPAVFIRAPVVVAVGPDVEVLATLGPGPGAGPGAAPHPVACRQGPVLATA
ncbi:MAG: pyridoxal 5'-phosphate synthase glutaminase subunit PdxT, partial [Acidimicrobiales bacterium]